MCARKISRAEIKAMQRIVRHCITAAAQVNFAASCAANGEPPVVFVTTYEGCMDTFRQAVAMLARGERIA